MRDKQWKRTIFIGLYCLFAGSLLAAAQTPGPKMTDTDRKALLKRFDDSTAQTLAAVEKLSDAQWAYKPAPDKWSVGETLEHIVLAEGLLFRMIEKTLGESANPAWAEKTKGKIAIIEGVMLDRSMKAQAPGEIAPAGKLTRAEALAKYKARREATRKFITETKAELHAHTGDHPFPKIGTLSAYQWLVYTALHNLRHNQQIEEVKAGPAFPKA
jgi:uncharacterized damage-inducible protein DinB